MNLHNLCIESTTMLVDEYVVLTAGRSRLIGMPRKRNGRARFNVLGVEGLLYLRKCTLQPLQTLSFGCCMSVVKGSWTSRVGERHRQATKPAIRVANGIVHLMSHLIFFLRFVAKFIHNNSVLVAYNKLFLVRTNFTYQLTSFRPQKATEGQVTRSTWPSDSIFWR